MTRRPHASESDSGLRRRYDTMHTQRKQVTAVAHRNQTAPRPMSPAAMRMPRVMRAPKYEKPVAVAANRYSSSTCKARSRGSGHEPDTVASPDFSFFAIVGPAEYDIRGCGHCPARAVTRVTSSHYIRNTVPTRAGGICAQGSSWRYTELATRASCGLSVSPGRAEPPSRSIQETTDTGPS